MDRGRTDKLQILDAFVAAGCNLIDTADIYSRWVPGNKGGESETVLGKWLSEAATAEGPHRHQGRNGNGTGPEGLSKSYILRAAEDSLTRLQTDYIDLYQSHTDDSETPWKIPWRLTRN